jgi:hypothetical protein
LGIRGLSPGKAYSAFRKAGFETEFFDVRFFGIENSVLESSQPRAVGAALFLVLMDIVTATAGTFHGSSDRSKHYIFTPFTAIHPWLAVCLPQYSFQYSRGLMRK